MTKNNEIDSLTLTEMNEDDDTTALGTHWGDDRVNEDDPANSPAYGDNAYLTDPDEVPANTIENG